MSSSKCCGGGDVVIDLSDDLEGGDGNVVLEDSQ